MESIFFDICRNGTVDEIPLEANLDELTNSRSPCGLTPLHVACDRGNLEMVKFLLGLGVLVNTKDVLGWSPLHSAAFRGYEEITTELLKVNGSKEAVYTAQDGPIDLDTVIIHKKLGDGVRPDDLAEHRKRHSIVKLIRSARLDSFLVKRSFQQTQLLSFLLTILFLIFVL